MFQIDDARRLWLTLLVLAAAVRCTQGGRADPDCVSVNAAPEKIRAVPGIGAYRTWLLVASRCCPFKDSVDFESKFQAVETNHSNEYWPTVNGLLESGDVCVGNTSGSSNCIDVNLATLSALAAKPGIGPAVAKIIVTARGCPYKDQADLESRIRARGAEWYAIEMLLREGALCIRGWDGKVDGGSEACAYKERNRLEMEKVAKTQAKLPCTKVCTKQETGAAGSGASAAAGTKRSASIFKSGQLTAGTATSVPSTAASTAAGAKQSASFSRSGEVTASTAAATQLPAGTPGSGQVTPGATTTAASAAASGPDSAQPSAGTSGSGQGTPGAATTAASAAASAPDAAQLSAGTSGSGQGTPGAATTAASAAASVPDAAQLPARTSGSGQEPPETATTAQLLRIATCVREPQAKMAPARCPRQAQAAGAPPRRSPASPARRALFLAAAAYASAWALPGAAFAPRGLGRPAPQAPTAELDRTSAAWVVSQHGGEPACPAVVRCAAKKKAAAGGAPVCGGDTVYIKVHTGKYIGELDGTSRKEWVKARGTKKDDLHALTIEKSGGGEIESGDTVKIVMPLKVTNGTKIHMDIVGSAVRARYYDPRGEWQKMTIIKQEGGVIRDGDTIFIRSVFMNGRDYMDANPLEKAADGEVKCRWPDEGEWQVMTIEK